MKIQITLTKVQRTNKLAITAGFIKFLAELFPCSMVAAKNHAKSIILGELNQFTISTEKEVDEIIRGFEEWGVDVKIDLLSEMILEPIVIKAKYRVGEFVWTMQKNVPEQHKVTRISITKRVSEIPEENFEEINYTLSSTQCATEDKFFRTLDELLRNLKKTALKNSKANEAPN